MISIDHIISIEHGDKINGDRNEVTLVRTTNGSVKALFETRKSIMAKIGGAGGASVHDSHEVSRAAAAAKLYPQAAEPAQVSAASVETAQAADAGESRAQDKSDALINIPGSPTPHEVLVGRANPNQVSVNTDGAKQPAKRTPQRP